MNKLIKQAFTLIELLVVIAIIGILSGLIVVSMSGVTQKATIAKAQVFSNSLRNALMLDLVSEYKLDQINSPSSNQIVDSWGLNVGTLSDTSGVCSYVSPYKCPQLQTTNCISSNCLSFDGSDDFVSLLNISNLDVTNLNTYTLSAWIKTSASATMAVIGYASLSGNAPIIQFGEVSSGLALFQHRDDSSNIVTITSSSPAIYVNDGKWHYVVGVRSSTNDYKLYVDGTLCGTGSTTVGTTTITEIALGVLKRAVPGSYFNGTADEIRIFKAAIPTSQIQEQYYIGLNNLLISGSITKEEYLNRFKELAIK